MRDFTARLAAVEIWPVALLVAAGAAVNRFLPFALALALFFWLVRWLAYGRLSVRTPVDWPAALLVVMAGVALLVTPLPDLTRPQVLRLLAGLALCYSLANWATSMPRLRLVLAGCVLLALGLSVLAALTVDFPAWPALAAFRAVLDGRVPSVLFEATNPNVIAGALVILVPFALAVLGFAWRDLGPALRLLALLVVLFTAGILTASQSRGGLMGIAAVLLVLVALRWRYGLLIAAALLILGLGLVANRPVATLDVLAGAGAIGGLDERLELWSRGLYMLQDFPFTGVGMGAYEPVARLLYPFFRIPETVVVGHAHNLFLQVGVDLGLPGLIAWLAFLLLVITMAYSIYRRGRRAGDPWLTAIGAALLAGQAGLIVHGLTDATTWAVMRSGVITWAIWGLALAAHHLVAVVRLTPREVADPA